MLNITDPSIDNLVHKYFNEHAIGSQKPSDFLHTAVSQLSALGVTPTNNADLLKRYFLSSLPMSIRTLFTVVDDSTEVEKLAALADRSFEILQSNNALPVAAATTMAHTAPQVDNQHSLTQRLEAMQLQFNSLQQSISAITAHMHDSQTHRRDVPTAQRNRSSSRHRFRSKSPGGRLVCYYHHRFRESAKRCNPGCKFYDNKFAVDNPVCIYHAKFQSQARSCVPGCKFYTNALSSSSSAFPPFSKNE